MPAIGSNGVELAYEEAGPQDGPVILLIMGLGVPLIFWPDEFVDGLAKRGFRVIRYDNRDAGRSTVLHGHRAPGLLRLATSAFLGRSMDPPYRLPDMAADAVGLLDALKVERVHLVGASMGGMIAQHVAAQYPERVSSLVSASSTSGAHLSPLPAPGVALRMIMSARGEGRATEVRPLAKLLRAISSADPTRRDPTFHDLALRIIKRGYYPAGIRRQFAAIMADGDRTELLRAIVAPTLVIHGEADRLLTPAHGVETARRIKGAQLRLIAGMAHDFPPSAVPELADIVANHAAEG
jgi:pimeloyl-ACP methyl ester carboxylesterase